MFYLAKSQSNEKELTKLLEQITENNPKYKEIIEYISNNGFRIEPEILQSNVKKGGKYIVFLPIVNELEDEDGNVIGRKKGKDKIKDYEKQIAEYFKRI